MNYLTPFPTSNMNNCGCFPREPERHRSEGEGRYAEPLRRRSGQRRPLERCAAAGACGVNARVDRGGPARGRERLDGGRQKQDPVAERDSERRHKEATRHSLPATPPLAS